MKQILVEMDRERNAAGQMDEVRDAWESGLYRSLMIHVFSGWEEEKYTVEVTKSLRAGFPQAQIVGTMSAGEIKEGRVMERGVLIAVTLFETTEVRVLRYDDVKGHEEAVGQMICQELDRIPEIQAAEVILPGTVVDTRPLFEQISRCDRKIKIFGGYSGGHMINSPVHFIFDESGVMFNSMFVTCFAGRDLHIDADKVIGWEALGLPFRVTKAEGNRLIELDGSPASQIYERFLQIDRRQHNNAEEGYTFPLMANYKGESWLRSAIHIEEDGSLDLHGYVVEGTWIQLTYGNPLGIVNKVNRRLRAVRKFRPQVIWLYSCIVRKAFWDGFVNIETEPFQAIAGTAGLHTWGEVIRDEVTGKVVEHNVTMLSVSMREGPASEDELPPEVLADVSVLRGSAAQLRRLTSMVRTTMGELQKAHHDLQVMNEKLVKMAEHDSLTGLYSRRKTEEIIRRTFESIAGTDQTFSLIMIDVDHFKQVNDKYGHHTGDLVLQRLAGLFQDAVKDCSCGAAGRWGGEEFFLVLPETGSADAAEIAEKLRKDVESEQFPDVGRVTISLGVITANDGMEPQSIFSRVDDALYEAKNTGRNRTVIADVG